MIATASAEAVGFGAAAVLFDAPAGPWLAGAIEGSCLGLAQGLVLARVRPGFPVAGWWAATAIVATLGWGSTSFFSGQGQGPEADTLAVLLMAAGLGGGMGLLLGTAQALVLRSRFGQAWLWVPASVAAWAAGMVPAFWVATAPFGPASAALDRLALGVAGGAAMGLIVGSVTGVALVRLPGRRSQRIA